MPGICDCCALLCQVDGCEDSMPLLWRRIMHPCSGHEHLLIARPARTEGFASAELLRCAACGRLDPLLRIYGVFWGKQEIEKMTPAAERTTQLRCNEVCRVCWRMGSPEILHCSAFATIPQTTAVPLTSLVSPAAWCPMCQGLVNCFF